MTSVTQVFESYIEPFLYKWGVKVGEKEAKRISKQALIVGKYLDEYVQKDINGEIIPEIKGIKDGEAITQINIAKKGWEKFKLKYPEYVKGIVGMQIELTQDGIVGHPDLEMINQIDDLKTGNSLAPRIKWVVQASKYAIMGKKEKAGLLILSKTNPDGAFQYITWGADLIDYFGRYIFDAYKTIYEANDKLAWMVRKHLEQEKLYET